MLFLLAPSALAQDALRPRDTPAQLVAFIDAEFASQWRDKKLQPSPTCSDHEFLRRAYLDINGTIPTAAKARAFYSDTRRDKRARLVDALLRALGRVITATRAYQLSSRATRSNAGDTRYFSKMPRRLQDPQGLV